MAITWGTFKTMLVERMTLHRVTNVSLTTITVGSTFDTRAQLYFRAFCRATEQIYRHKETILPAYNEQELDLSSASILNTYDMFNPRWVRINGKEIREASWDWIEAEYNQYSATAGQPIYYARMNNYVIRFERPLGSASSVVVSAATNATPIVITTASAHGLTDLDRVVISGALGNTAANGTHHVNVLTTTTAELYSNYGLSAGVAGNGVYTASSATLYAPYAQTTNLVSGYVDHVAFAADGDTVLIPELDVDIAASFVAAMFGTGAASDKVGLEVLRSFDSNAYMGMRSILGRNRALHLGAFHVGDRA